MARFMTRVELYDSEDADYEELHEEMEKRGFKRTISASFSDDDEEIVYQLPAAEYLFEGDKKKEDVCGLAKAAVKAIKKTSGIVVVKTAGIYISGLKKPKKK